MNPTGSPRTGHTWIRATSAALSANLVLAAIAATTALARGGSGSHSFSGGGHSSGHSSFHGSSGHFIFHNGHYYYTTGGGGSHVAGAVITAIVLGSFALIALIPLTIWFLRRSRAAAKAAVHAAEAHHKAS
jgi:hypothetical protein